MLVDQQFRKCVGFLFVDVFNEETGAVVRRPAATVFYVGLGRGDTSAYYAVTARHVIEKARPYETLYVRVNKHGLEYEDLAISASDWLCHAESDVAIAAMPYDPSMDILFVPFEMLATDDYVSGHNVTEGDKVFFTGLFSQVPGLTRTQPIVRFGNIALMPREQIDIKIFPDSDKTMSVRAYLVESRSWGGHSGSPAFIYYADTDRMPVVVVKPSEPPALLGLVHGHYEIRSDVEFVGDILGSGSVPLNAGVAVVIPAQHIVDLLTSPEMGEGPS